jgi:hypothetical protein
MFVTKEGTSAMGNEQDREMKDSDKSIFKNIYIILSIGILLLAVAWYLHNEAVMIATIAVIGFLIPIVLAFSYDYNLATVDNGVIRKSITISLTIVYIIILSIFVANNPSIFDPDQNLTANSNESTSHTSNSVIYGPNVAKDLLNSSGSSGSIGNENKSPDAGQNISSRSSSGIDNQNGSPDAGQNIPSEAIKSIYQNFLYVYVIIIGFYFGSRTAESYWNTNLSKEILKDASGLEILEKRYAMGEINEIYIDRMRERLRTLKLDRMLLENVDAKIDEKTITEIQGEISKIEGRLDSSNDKDTKELIERIKGVVDKLRKKSSL